MKTVSPSYIALTETNKPSIVKYRALSPAGENVELAGERVKGSKCGCHPLNAGDLVGLEIGTKTLRGPSGSALLLCVAGVHCWEISLGLADPGNVICLSCRFILGFSCIYLLSIVS